MLQSTLSEGTGGGGDDVYCQWEVDREWFYITLGMGDGWPRQFDGDCSCANYLCDLLSSFNVTG